jgi:hypothetical protein
LPRGSRHYPAGFGTRRSLPSKNRRSGDGVENGRSLDLDALNDLDLLAEGDLPVAGEMDRERARRRPRSGILSDSGCRIKHARLPVAAAASEAVRSDVQLLQGGEVGCERGDRCFVFEGDIDVRRTVSVQLDRQPRTADAERGEELALPLERLPHRDGLLHPPEHGPFLFALEANRHWACACLEGDLVASERGADHERRPQHGRAGEGQLCSRREDANKHITVVLRRQEKTVSAIFKLAGQVLHLLRGERPAIHEHAEPVAL